MSQAELAGHAVVPVAVIADFEARVSVPRASNLDAIRAALERASVEFIGGDRPGVRLSKAGTAR
jgi:hypothetical protein